jgi:hypothetical protein
MLFLLTEKLQYSSCIGSDIVSAGEDSSRCLFVNADKDRRHSELSSREDVLVVIVSDHDSVLGHSVMLDERRQKYLTGRFLDADVNAGRYGLEVSCDIESFESPPHVFCGCSFSIGDKPELVAGCAVSKEVGDRWQQLKGKLVKRHVRIDLLADEGIAEVEEKDAPSR